MLQLASYKNQLHYSTVESRHKQQRSLCRLAIALFFFLPKWMEFDIYTFALFDQDQFVNVKLCI